jgi:hypothetical protein
VSERYDVFLSYSRNDLEVATLVLGQLNQAGLEVFRDQEGIREGELWLNRLQEAVDACGAFVVLVGRDGVRRWIGAETQVALNRHFGPHDDAQRLPIFPILLVDTDPGTLPAFLRLFQATPWDGTVALPDDLLDQIRKRTLVHSKIAFEGCPFVGLDAFGIDQAQLFFGRQKETLDALACFDTRPGSPTVRWLEITGNSGSGKSSLMNAGLLPLVDQGWLWPRTGYERWKRIGPMMPGERPVAMLAEHLARAFGEEMTGVREHLDHDDERRLAEWLRSRKQDGTAVLLAIDQFEELFTVAEPAERARFDRLLGHALDDPECPLFVLSTVRSDFLDRYDELLPRLVPVRNRSGKLWTLPLISADGLREIITGPAQLAGLVVSEVRDLIVDQARDEPGALPLVQNALNWLWEQRVDDRLSGRLLSESGGIAGILSHNADTLLSGLGRQRERALELLFRLVKVDPEGRRHTRQRIPLPEAVAVAGGGEAGRALVNRLAGERRRDGGRTQGPLRLITVTGGAEDGSTGRDGGQWVNLIHETLIRSKGLDAAGKPQPYWPTLWAYIESNRNRAARRERLQLQAREWQERRGLARLLGLAGWSSFFGYRRLAPGSLEARYLRWSRARSLVEVAILIAAIGAIAEALLWMATHEQNLQSALSRWQYLAGMEDFEFPTTERVPPMGGRPMRADAALIRPITDAAPLYFGSTEVTFDQYDAFARATGRSLPSASGWGRGTQPVINVDWEDARAYARWLAAMTGATCRLPSEAEWEYACRAGTDKEFALPKETGGSDDIAGKGLANCGDCGSEWHPAPVRSFLANAWGLYDMHGNVMEWVEDCVDDEASVTACSPVLRGGSWYNSQDNARCANRSGGAPDVRDYGIGFRVVCSSPITNR